MNPMTYRLFLQQATTVVADFPLDFQRFTASCLNAESYI
jgi:hypothetical protein